MNFDVATEPVDLAGQVAIVTGGGRGLGRAFASAFAAAGAAVAVIARSADQLSETVAQITEAGGHARAYTADVTDQNAAKQIIAEVERSLGPVDLLVNNAGTATPLGPITDVDLDQWWRCLEVNLRGPLLYCQAVLPSMIARRQGRIINVASGAGTIAIANMSAYVVSKAALIRLTEILATEVRDHDIKVFAIEPGTVRTAMAEYALESPEGKQWMPAWFSKVFKEGRDVPPDYAARLVLQLASGSADALSGRFIDVYDNLQEMAAQEEKIRREGLYSLRLRKLK